MNQGIAMRGTSSENEEAAIDAGEALVLCCKQRSAFDTHGFCNVNIMMMASVLHRIGIHKIKSISETECTPMPRLSPSRYIQESSRLHVLNVHDFIEEDAWYIYTHSVHQLSNRSHSVMQTCLQHNLLSHINVPQQPHSPSLQPLHFLHQYPASALHSILRHPNPTPNSYSYSTYPAAQTAAGTRPY